MTILRKDRSLSGYDRRGLRASSPRLFPHIWNLRTAVDWVLAQAWEEELQKLDVKRPSTIPGIDKLADTDEVLSSLLPWRLTNEDFLRMNQDEGTNAALRRIAEAHLVNFLDHLGF